MAKRRGWLVCAMALWVYGWGASEVAGQSSEAARAPAVGIVLHPPKDLRAGDRRQLLVDVTVRPRQGHPLLFTPSSEGTAIEIVRGRLLRSDADDPEAAVLRFRVPMIAHHAGTSIVRVHVLGYVCKSTCRSVEAEGSLVVRVRPSIESAAD